MCLSQPKIPQDNSAQIAQQQADKRQADITAGKQNIDSAFSKFDDNYFNDYGKAYVDNYNPQVDDQYNRAVLKNNYAAARAGIDNSTPAFTSNDKLNLAYGDQRRAIAANANTAVDSLKTGVANQKSQLYALNSSAADPSAAASNATAAAGTMPSTPQYSVLGDLFGSLINNGSAYIAGRNQALPPGYANVFNAGSGLPSAGGSGRIVG